MDIKVQLSVDMACQSCVDDITQVLKNVNGVDKFDISLESKQVIVEGTARPSTVLNAIKESGRAAVVRGTGSSLGNIGAAVCIFEEGRAMADSKTRGLARFVQVSDDICFVDITVSGIADGAHGVAIHENGDLSNVPESCGKLWNPDLSEHGDLKQRRGDLGSLVVKDGWGGLAFETERFKVWEIIGRSMVVGAPDNGTGASAQSKANGSGPGILAGVVARSAGLFENDKQVCACSGNTLWTEEHLFSVKAVHSYSKNKSEELELKEGDTVRVSNDDDPSWWTGTNDRTKESGWFPSSFVHKIETKPKLKRRVRIVKRFEATDEDDLTLEVGDVVDVKKEVDGWYLGRHNGNIGMFPANYAEEYMEDTPAARPLPQPPMPLARRGTAGPGASLPQPPQATPSLPSRNPPLPPRASTDIGLGPAAGEKMHAAMSPLSDEDPETKKEKKTGRRISRLFGTMKHKHKDEPESTNDHTGQNEEASIDSVVSPTKPLPQPNMTINSPPPNITSPLPPAPRALPPAPSAGVNKLPAAPAVPAPVPAPAPAPVASVPAPAPAVPAPAPAVPAPAPAVPTNTARRPSAGDIAKDSTSPANTRPSTAKSASDDDDVEQGEEPAKSRGQAKLAKIIQDYEAQSPEELNLMKDDVVTIISRGTDEEPRWKGEYHGKKGYFPGSTVEPISESATLDEDDSQPRGGFRLAAYGVQQGGLGSIFASGGMPALRKSAPRKNSDAESIEAPAQAPGLHKLRSVPRVPVKDPAPKKEEEQPNFLAHLNRVPRKQVPSASSEDSVSPRPMAAPVVPISRKSTLAEVEPEVSIATPDIESTPSPELDTVPEAVSDAVVPQDTNSRPHTSSSKSGDDDEASDEPKSEEATDEPEETAKAPVYDPVRSPALPQVKRLVRRGPRQMPTAEALKKGSGESQAQSLRTALQNDKDAEPEQEPGSPKTAPPPPVSEKPKNPRFGMFGGPQLPTGGFKATGRVGSAMASRLAALQARTAGGDEEEEPVRSAPSRSVPSDATSPPLVARKPSFTPRAHVDNEPAPSSAVSNEWQKKIESEQLQLRDELERARKNGDQVEQLVARLTSSERDNQMLKQTISGLERQIDTLVSQMSALQTSLTGVQQSVTGLESKGVSSSQVSVIVKSEVQNAIEPLRKLNQERMDESKMLDKKIAELRAYVDELVVEEEE
ncbi:copper chaperone [Coemansia sp. RSA 1972]|nr:copper chaperone [Coemansia sp. RSA 1972]